MKKLIFLTLVIGAGFLSFNYLSASNLRTRINNWFSIDTKLPEIDLEIEKPDYVFDYYSNHDLGIYAAKFDSESVSLEYLSQMDLAKSTSEHLDESNSSTSILINAGYFTPEFSHIGLLAESGDISSSLSFNNPQANAVVQFNNGTLSDFMANDYVYSNEVDLAFQTGPLIIKDNIIQSESINNSLNGNGTYLRSVVGYSDEGYGFILASINTVALSTIGEFLINEDVFFTGNITAVNLDGGSSVSFASSENEEFGYRRDKKLPYYIKISTNKKD
jgi:uncharacterized protein YigE (DUF2233 family)